MFDNVIRESRLRPKAYGDVIIHCVRLYTYYTGLALCDLEPILAAFYGIKLPPNDCLLYMVYVSSLD